VPLRIGVVPLGVVLLAIQLDDDAVVAGEPG
jgi:hypothetical protein